jgi:hypothetical protein
LQSLIGAVSGNRSNKKLQNCSPIKAPQGNELIHCLSIKGIQICSLLLELFPETAPIRKPGELLLLFRFSNLIIKNLAMNLMFPGRKPICAHFSPGEIRTCCVSPRKKIACVAFLPRRNRMLFGVAPLATVIPRFLDCPRGEIQNLGIINGHRGNSKQHAISLRERCSTCAFLTGEMQHMRVSPRQRCNTCEFLPGRNATCCVSPREKCNTGLKRPAGLTKTTEYPKQLNT